MLRRILIVLTLQSKHMKKPKKHYVYKIAHDRFNDCTDKDGHEFYLIRDKATKDAIRAEHKRLKYALWQCSRCHKITQGT